MESTSLYSPTFPRIPCSKYNKLKARRRASHATTFAARREEEEEAHGQNHHQGRLVDTNMIVLRKRIREVKMVEERSCGPPSDWMEWEKQCFGTSYEYDSWICEVMGLLQSRLMNARPSLALGTLALIALSVPTSSAVVFFKLLETIKIVLDGM